MMSDEAKKARISFVQAHPTGPDDNKIPEFYEKISEVFEFGKIRQQKIAFIVVDHLVHTLPYFIECLSTIGCVAAIIPKSSRTVPSVVKTIKKLYHEILYSNINKETFWDVNKSNEFLESILNKSELKDHHFVLLDHGGYFAPRLKDTLNKLSERFLGITEHTLNGEMNYQKQLSQDIPSPIPIYSIARTKLKSSEDAFVAQSIVDAIRTRVFGSVGLRQCLDRLQNIVIIGYGHMGSHVANTLRNDCPETIIYICDSSDTAQTKARADHFEIKNKKEIISKADLIITATSTLCMTREDFAILKPQTCVACVTSKDNQFSADALADYQEVPNDDNLAITKYQHTKNKNQSIYLAENGCSVNFPLGSTSHPIMQAVLASVCVQANTISTNNPNKELLATHIQLTNIENAIIIQEIWDVTFGIFIEPIKNLNKIWLKRHTISNVSAPCHPFIGRKTFVQNMYAKLHRQKQQPAILSITGGRKIGKSEVVKKYVLGYQHLYSLIWWFSEKKDLWLSLNQLATELHRQLDVDIDFVDPKTRAQAIKQIINQYGNWLLIFDGVQQYNKIKDFIPNQTQGDKKGHVLITSNTSHVPNPYKLGPWTVKESLNYAARSLSAPNLFFKQASKKLAPTIPTTTIKTATNFCLSPNNIATTIVVANQTQKAVSKQIKASNKHGK